MEVSAEASNAQESQSALPVRLSSGELSRVLGAMGNCWGGDWYHDDYVIARSFVPSLFHLCPTN